MQTVKNENTMKPKLSRQVRRKLRLDTGIRSIQKSLSSERLKKNYYVLPCLLVHFKGVRLSAKTFPKVFRILEAFLRPF